jgi:hypothetical protein
MKGVDRHGRQKKTTDLLIELHGVWKGCAPVFKQRRTWERGWRLMLSMLVCLGRHTITGVICASGRLFQDWASDYRFFSKDQWQATLVFTPVIRSVLEMVPDSMPFVVAMDDTLLKKIGLKVPNTSYARDPLSPPFHCNLIRGQRFIQLSALLPAGEGPGPARAIPIRFEAAPPAPKPKRNAPSAEWDVYKEEAKQKKLNRRGVGLIADLRGQLDEEFGCPDRILINVVDGSYTNKTCIQGLPERTVLIGRIRRDAKLYFPPRPQDQPAVGSKRQYGRRAPTPDELLRDETVPFVEVSAYAAGKLQKFKVKTLDCVQWKKAGADRRLRVVAIKPVGYRLRKGSKVLYRQPAYLICTDPDLPVEKVVQYYLWRWDIEVNHRDEKQIIGVGQAQVRNPKSVERVPAFAVAAYAMLLLAGVKAFGVTASEALLPLPKWRRDLPKHRLSTQDLVQTLRSALWSETLDPKGNINSEDFADTPPDDTKSPELQLPPGPAVIHSAA